MTQASTDFHSALDCVRSGDTVVAPLMPGGPLRLLEALCARLGELKNITLICGDLEGRHAWLDAIPEGCAGELKLLLLAGKAPRRTDIAVDWAPLPLYDVTQAFATGAWRVDVALAAVTPPDDEGLHRVTPTLAWMREAVQTARDVVVEVSPHLPLLKGGNGIAPQRLTTWVNSPARPVVQARGVVDDTSKGVARHVATLVAEHACLQIGIGSLVEALLLELRDHRDLGLHTGALPEGILDLIDVGVFTNARNPHRPGRLYTMSARGSEEMYARLNGDARVLLESPSFIGDPHVIAQLDDFTAINSAMAVDFYGQVNAETVAGRLRTSGGGQMDYARAARLAKGGRSIIMLAATGGKDQASRIVPRFAAGDLVTTHRCDVDFIVTEYGVADLRNTALKERARRLIAIAHPMHREMLEKAARQGA